MCDYASSIWIVCWLLLGLLWGEQFYHEPVSNEDSSRLHHIIWGGAQSAAGYIESSSMGWDDVCSGHLVGYRVSGKMGWQIFLPKLNDTIYGVNCIFNEIIRAMQIEVVKDEAHIDNLKHLVGTKYFWQWDETWVYQYPYYTLRWRNF